MNERLEAALTISIKEFSDNYESKQEIAYQISENFDLFEKLLERTVDIGDDSRTTIIESSFRVECDDVSFLKDLTGGTAYATFDTHFYAGCKDMNSEDSHGVNLDFEIRDKDITFNINLPLPWIPEAY